MEKTYIIEALRKCYDADFGVVAAARRVKVDFQTAKKYYEEFARAPKGAASVSLGEPPPERSALASFKPWKPEYNDKPVVVRRPSWEEKPEVPKEEVLLKEPSKPKAAKTNGPMPSAFDIGLVLTVIAKAMEIDPLELPKRLFDGERHGSKVTYARIYAFLILERLYPNTSKRALAACLGVSKTSQHTYGSNIYYRMKVTGLPGYDRALFEAMMSTVETKKATMNLMPV